MELEMHRLEDLGWSSFFEAHWSPEERETLTPARIMEEHRNFYRLSTQHGDLMSEISGRLFFQAQGHRDLPAVGDWLLVQARWQERRATIQRVLPRRSKLSRKVAGSRVSEQIVAANVDTLFLVNGLDGDFNLRRMERYLALAWESGGQPVILLNKADLCDRIAERMAAVEEIAVGAPVHVLSAATGWGMDALSCYLGKGQTVALLGSSGVGKSTLINRLVGTELQKVQETRECDDRGRHTTTSRKLILLPAGGILVDTPGMRELQLWDSSEGLQRTFGDIESLAANCRFRDCRHLTEPGCAVREAMNEGSLDARRLASYAKLQKEQRYLARKQDVVARLEDKRKWKKIHKALRDRPA